MCVWLPLLPNRPPTIQPSHQLFWLSAKGWIPWLAAFITGSDAFYIMPSRTNTKQEKPFETGKLSYIIGLRATRIEEIVCKARESRVYKACLGLLRLMRKLQYRSLCKTNQSLFPLFVNEGYISPENTCCITHKMIMGPTMTLVVLRKILHTAYSSCKQDCHEF